MIVLLSQQIKDLDVRITALETRMKQAHKADPVSRLLEGIPGMVNRRLEPGAHGRSAQFRSGVISPHWPS